MPETGWLINNRNLFLTVRGWVMAIAELVSNKCLLPDSIDNSHLPPHMVEGERDNSLLSFIRTVVLFMGFYPHDLITSWKPSLLIPSLWGGGGLRFEHRNFRETQSFSLIQFKQLSLWVKVKWSCSVMPDSSRPDGLQPTRLLHGRIFRQECMGFSRQEYWSGLPLPSLLNHV